MQHANANEQLSLISTRWSMISQAHQAGDAAAHSARQRLFERYGSAVYRYLGEVLHDSDAVDEVFQEFALELVRGHLRGADPRRGRFRDFLKGTLFHLIADYRKLQREWSRRLPAGNAVAPSRDGLDVFEITVEERRFAASWRDELLARAWAGLADFATGTRRHYYTVLRFRANHPEVRSPEMAEQLTHQLGQPCTAVWVRQTLHRAREKFAELLLEEITFSLADPTAEQIEQELVELELLDYCRHALLRSGSQG
jgi:RNA polymerase sigma-70 factor (ECF subfamily)